MFAKNTISEENRTAFTFASKSLTGVVDMQAESFVLEIGATSAAKQVFQLRIKPEGDLLQLEMRLNDESIFTGTTSRLGAKLEAARALEAIRVYLGAPSGKAVNDANV